MKIVIQVILIMLCGVNIYLSIESNNVNATCGWFVVLTYQLTDLIIDNLKERN